MTVLLEYLDLDCSIRVSQSFLANIKVGGGGLASPSPQPMIDNILGNKIISFTGLKSIQ